MTVNNSIFTIDPYWDEITWVFDDDRVGLIREPFIAGIPDMINHMVRDIPDADNGFRCYFSKTEYPGYSYALSWTGEEYGGHWYKMDQEPFLSGWLCPAMFHYFTEAPEKLYVSAEPLTKPS